MQLLYLGYMLANRMQQQDATALVDVWRAHVIPRAILPCCPFFDKEAVEILFINQLTDHGDMQLLHQRLAR